MVKVLEYFSASGCKWKGEGPPVPEYHNLKAYRGIGIKLYAL
jgi:hypothetical protein